MRELNILVVFLAVCLVLLFIENARPEKGFVEENYVIPLAGEVPKLTLNLSSDKTVYHSSEEMEIKTTIATNSKAENLTIKVYGIKDSRGNYRVNGEKTVGVDPPGTSETFVFQMPSCYGCAGVSSGDYEIVTEVIRNGEVLENSSKTVTLEK
jgi:hypothetical protein